MGIGGESDIVYIRNSSGGRLLKLSGAGVLGMSERRELM